MVKTEDTSGEDRVRLPAIMGVRPGVYLAAIYGVVIAAVLFVVLLYPGLARPGALVVFNSEPAGAALRVDGLYAGTAPDRIFVPKGTHTLEAVLPGFTPRHIDCEIPGRVFASTFFPRLYPLEITLTAPDYDAVFSRAAVDFAAWSFGGEPTASWQIPLSLSEGAYRAGKNNSSAAEETLEAAARFAVTRAAMRDLVRAQFLAGSGGLSPSPAGLYHSARDMLAFLSRTPEAAAWLKNTLPADSAAIIEKSAWYQKQIASSDETAPEGNPRTRANTPPAERLNLGGLSYTGIDGAAFKKHIFEPFMICDTEVSRNAFEIFIAENPEWEADQSETLAAAGLADANYLRDEKPAGLLNGGVAGVSWFAAQAYCEWLSKQLPSSMSNCEVRLPYEAEWEYAAALFKNRATSAAAALPNMAGGMWEWCADPYAPLDFTRVTREAAEKVGSPERSLRGWLNAEDKTGFKTRASLPPGLCSSFVSFRPVIAIKSE